VFTGIAHILISAKFNKLINLCLKNLGVVQKVLEDMLSIFVSLVHLWILEKFLANSMRWFLVVYFMRYCWKFLMGPLYGM
jgi:hypothetical protein